MDLDEIDSIDSIDSIDEIVTLQKSLDFLQAHIHHFTTELYYHFQNIEHHSNQQPLTTNESSKLIVAVIRGLTFNDHCMSDDHDFSSPFALMFHFHTLHWTILHLLLALLDNKSLQLPIDKLLPIIKNITLTNQSADTRHVAMEVMVRFMLNEPQKLVNELLAILHQPHSASDVISAAYFLTDIIIYPIRFKTLVLGVENYH